METLDTFDTFYPTLDYDATSASPQFNTNDQALHIGLDSFAGLDPLEPHNLLRRQFTGSSGLDDVFSDTLSNFETPILPDQQDRTPPLETEDLRLKFSNLKFHFPLLEYAYRTAPVSIDAQLNGMFFGGLLDSPDLTTEQADPATKSLTCYRRNLFGVTGSLSIPRSLRYISTEQGEQIPIISTQASLAATESMEGAPVKLICVPYKSNIAVHADYKGEEGPSSIPLDLLAGAETDPSFATFQLEWKRLQFRLSTANNGRRKELQQHFILKISLHGVLSTGQQVTLCESTRGPIIVRGRSPRNFQQKGPTSGSIYGSKPQMQRFSSTGDLAYIKSEPDYNFDINDLGFGAIAWNGKSHIHKGAMTALPPDTFRIDPKEFFAQSSPDLSRYSKQLIPAPLNLSLVEDGTAPRNPAQGGLREKLPRLASTQRPPSFSLGDLQGNNNDDDADPLYEYFPLGLDDWQEPVDAVYRPHVVHHIAIPVSRDVTKSRSKRYFSNMSPS